MNRLIYALLGAALAFPALAITPDEAIAALRKGLDKPLRHEGQPDLPGLDAQLRERELRGLSIAVIHQGRVHWALGFGEARAGVPVTADTRFQAGSISKPVGALTALLLAEQRGQSVDANLLPQLRGWQAPPEDGVLPRYTLRRLLSHSAGLGVHGFPGYPRDAVLPSTAQILDGLPPANTAAVRPVEAPGQRYRYSGGGSTVVQLWLEAVSQEPYPKLAQRMLLQPLGMSHSQIGAPVDDHGFAHAHQRGVAEPGGFRAYPEGIAAGLWSTPSDLAKLLMAVQRARAGEPGVIPPNVARTATTLVFAPTAPGFFVDGDFFGHNGGNQGFEAMATASLQGGEGLVVMANDNGTWPLLSAVRRTVARLYGWSEGSAPLAPAKQQLPASAALLAGQYGALRVHWQQGMLWLSQGDEARQRLWRIGTDRFALDNGETLVLNRQGLQRGKQALLPRSAP